MRCRHVHIIGMAGTGKSTLMEAMILDDVQRGEGVLVLDPHGCMTTRLLHLLPRHAIDNTIYFKPGDPDWVPLWNPLQCGFQVNRAPLVDGLVGAIMNGSKCCRRMQAEHLLRQAIFAVLHLPEGNLLDAATLLRKKSAESRRLRSRILTVIDNECALSFWKHEFPSYTDDDLAVPQLVISKLLMADGIGAMLSEPASSFTLRDVMDSGKILLVDLSATDAGTAGIIGRFMLSSLSITAIGRRSTADGDRRPFHVYCDEAHRFAVGSLEELFSEARTSGITLTFAHQYLDQFGSQMKAVLYSMGSMIVFRVSHGDSEHLAEELRKPRMASELIALNTGEAVARIDEQVVRLRTFPPAITPQHHFRDEIVARCHQVYCLPSERILRALR